MLDTQLLRSDLDGVARRLAERGFALDTAPLRALEEERKAVQTRTQELQAQRNQSSKAIGQAKGRGEDVAPLMAQVAAIADELAANERRLEDIRTRLQDILAVIPNIPHESVPAGRSSDDNVEVRRSG